MLLHIIKCPKYPYAITHDPTQSVINISTKQDGVGDDMVVVSQKFNMASESAFNTGGIVLDLFRSSLSAPEKFVAAAALNPVCNLAMMVGTTDIPKWCFVNAFGTSNINSFTKAPSAEDLPLLYGKSTIANLSKCKKHSDVYEYAPAACIEGDGDDDDGSYDNAPAASMEGNDDDDDGGYDYAPAA
ncbi:hypothetical protein L6164_037426 [Bauhinia variegata]|uniref:Uncharacterized protein n=1 Tax=Bauhinia variegata TaxID=167791 RepID=A0ACB9KK54_BAUVA|nr:hypothetical protein L6164_037426 [Bauhinia variegata]